METEPSMVVFINDQTQEASFNFRPQNLSPEQYGVVLSSMVLHIARLFQETNPEKSEKQIVHLILDGVLAGLEQSEDATLPTKTH